MPQETFAELARAQWSRKRFLCIGLDPDLSQIHTIPTLGRVEDDAEKLLSRFLCAIIEATGPYAGAFKPNLWFYLQYGVPGLLALGEVIRHAKKHFPDIPVILDAKSNDIGNTSEAAAHFVFEACAGKGMVDAVTLSPYLGMEALHPFTRLPEKGVFILARTSNRGAEGMQVVPAVRGTPLYLDVMRQALEAQPLAHLGFVVGATHLPELKAVRRRFRGSLLVPGVGEQGGELERTLTLSHVPSIGNFFFNVSRGVLYSSLGSNFATAACLAARMYHQRSIDILKEGV